MLILADLNIERPWARERVPGLKIAINKQKKHVELIDIFEALGYSFLSKKKLYERKAFFMNRSNVLSAQNHLLNFLLDKKYTYILFTTMDNCIDFLDLDFLKTLNKHRFMVGAILGDDEFNYPNFRSIVPYLQYLVVYLKKAARYYKKYTNAIISVQNNCYSQENVLPLKDISEKKIDFTLVGAPFKNRLKLLRDILKNSEIKLAIYGPIKRWKKYPEFRKYYRGFLSPSKFYETLSRSKYIFCSLHTMNGRKHMNTKIWEALTAGSIPICEPYPALSYQFGLKEDLKIPYYYKGEDILEIIENNSENTNLRKIRKFIKGKYDYETSYTTIINTFFSLDLNDDVKKTNSTQFCAAPHFFKNKKLKPYILLPGVNIYKIEGQSIIKIGIIESIKSILSKKVSRTDFVLYNENNNYMNVINGFVYSSYLIIKNFKKTF